MYAARKVSGFYMSEAANENESPDTVTHISDVLLEKLTDISHGMGSQQSTLEGLREDFRDLAINQKAFSGDMSARVDNMTMRLARLEESQLETKKKVDTVIMPLVEATKIKRAQIYGAVRFWGIILAGVTSLSTVFWSRLLSWVLWISGGH